MKHSWHWMRTLLTLTLVLTLCGLTPAAVPNVGYAESAAEGTTAAAAYGMATADDVIVRKQPSTSANYWFRINTGFVCEILDTVVRGDTTWYKVNSTHPTPNGRTYIGYVRASFFRPLTAEETEAYLAGGRVNVTATPAPAQTPALTLQPSADDALVTATPASGSDFPFDTSIMGGTTSTPLVSMITPTPTTSQVTYGTGEITASGTNFRVAPSLSAGVIGKLNSGTVVTLLTIPDTIDENHWYQIRYNGQEGYIQSNFIRVLTAAVTATPQPSVYGTVKLLYDSANLRDAPNGTTRALWQGKGSTLSVAGISQDKGGFTWYPVYYGTDNTVYYVRSDVVEYTAGSGVINTPTPTPASGSAYGYVITTAAGVNLRLSAGGEVIVQVPRNVVLTCIGAPVQTSGSSYLWYYVRYNNLAGYIRGDFVRVCDQNGNPLGEATAAPSVTATPVVYSGYVKLTKTGVNLRVSPAGRSQGQYDIGLILPIAGATVSSGRYQWFCVRTPDGKTGYVRSDCAVPCDLNGNQVTVTPTPAPTGSIQQTSYVQTTLDYVNLRQTASRDSKSVAKVRTGTVLAFNATTTAGTSTWYRVVYNSTEVWVLGRCVKVMTQAEYQEWLNKNPGAATPQPDAAKGYIVTTRDGVNIRATANGSNILTRVKKGTVLPYYTENIKAGSYTWYLIRLSNGTEGYIRSDMVSKSNNNGGTLPTATPAPSGNPATKPSATYTTLRLGSTGDAVTRLVQELINQGYYTGSVTNVYTSAVRAAVRAFQSAKGLTVDGIAGKQTQHALFGTVEPGADDYTDYNFQFYPAEKIDWYTGGIQQLWAKGASYKIYDVKTGIVWWARRWAGYSHADIEPVTAADTARLCQIYGVNNAQEIWDKNLWQRRPCLITIGNRTFACSLFGMPHNPDGDTIPDNNMTGQICMHFTNSKGHESGKVDTYHQQAIEYAWQNCPAGHK